MNLTRARLSSYVNGLKTLSSAAQAELSNALFDVWQATGRDIDALHDAVNMLAPPIAAKYGQASGTLAAELWEEIYRADTGRSASAIIDDADDSRLFGASSGYAFSGDAVDPDLATAHVLGTMNKAVNGHARRTMTRNTANHGGRYARVPTGATTCAFCLMLASRGFVYRSAESAGEFDSYHSNCDCQVIASFDEDNSAIDGYDPDEYLAMYRAAARESVYESTEGHYGKHAEGHSRSSVYSTLTNMRKMYGLK